MKKSPGRALLIRVCAFVLLIYLLASAVSRFTAQGANFTENSINTDFSRARDLGERRFNNFIWFVVDGWPMKFAGDFLQEFKESSYTYDLTLSGLKYSHSVYASFITGRASSNLYGSSVGYDNLFRSLNRSGSVMRYIGPEWSLLSLVPSHQRTELFPKIDVVDDSDDEVAYSFFYKNATQRQWWLNDVLADVDVGSFSLVTHSGTIDKVQHEEYFANPKMPTFNRSWSVETNLTAELLGVREWIDDHPDVLLIITSDHGHDEMSSIFGYILHGIGDEGNHGFVVLYSPQFDQASFRGSIDSIDFCATLCSFLEIDIPQYNIGVSQAEAGAFRSLSAMKEFFHLNLRQLERLTDQPVDQGGDASSSVEDTIKAAQELRILALKGISHSWTQIVLCCIGLVFTIVWLVRFIGFSQSLAGLRILVVIAPLVDDFGFVYWRWMPVNNSGAVKIGGCYVLAIYLIASVLRKRKGRRGLWWHHMRRLLLASEATVLVFFIFRNTNPSAALVVILNLISGVVTFFSMLLLRRATKENTPGLPSYRVTPLRRPHALLRSEPGLVLVGLALALVHLLQFTKDWQRLFLTSIFPGVHAVAAAIWALVLVLFTMGWAGASSSWTACAAVVVTCYMAVQESTAARCAVASVCATASGGLYLISLFGTDKKLLSGGKAEFHKSRSVCIALVVYVTVAFPLRIMYMGLRTPVSLEVDINPGLVGLASFQVNHLLSGLMMAAAKFGIALIPVLSASAAFLERPSGILVSLDVALYAGFAAASFAFNLLMYKGLSTMAHDLNSSFVAMCLWGARVVVFNLFLIPRSLLSIKNHRKKWMEKAL